MINKDKLKLNYSSHELTYETDKYVYKIKLLDGIFESLPMVSILYLNSYYLRKYFSQLEHEIPKLHRDVIKELFDIYEEQIILPATLTNKIKYENDLIY